MRLDPSEYNMVWGNAYHFEFPEEVELTRDQRQRNALILAYVKSVRRNYEENWKPDTVVSAIRVLRVLGNGLSDAKTDAETDALYARQAQHAAELTGLWERHVAGEDLQMDRFALNKLSSYIGSLWIAPFRAALKKSGK